MKPVISLLAIGMFLFAGCAKDDAFDERLEGLELKEVHNMASVPIPFKAELCAVPDMESESILLPIPGLDPANPASYCKKRMIIGGTGTHPGRVEDSGTSFIEHFACRCAMLMRTIY